MTSERDIAARVDEMLDRYSGIIAHASAEDMDVLIRALAVIASYGDDLPDDLAAEIQSISVYGVAPEWQIAELRKILDRWAPRQ